jgi:Uncharacterised protein family (UPF0175)
MTVTFELPDEVAQALAASGIDFARRAKESLALEEFRAGRLSQAQLRRMLGFSSRYELDGFLKANGVFEDYTLDEFERDRAALRAAGF